MKGDLHVRFWEELRGKFPRLTRLILFLNFRTVVFVDLDDLWVIVRLGPSSSRAG